MNDENSKELENSVSNINEVSNAGNVQTSGEVVSLAQDVVPSGVQQQVNANVATEIQEVAFPEVVEEKNVVEEGIAVEDKTVVSETVIDADVNNEVKEDEQASGIIEEVSVSVDSNVFNTLSETEVGIDSVFNKKIDTPEEVAGMKEGQELKTEKKSFPFVMVLIFILTIVGAFNIDKITEFVKNQNKKDKVIEENNNEKENVTKEDFSHLTLIDFDAQMKKEVSVNLADDTKIITSVGEDKYTISLLGTDETGASKEIVVVFDYKDGILSSNMSKTDENVLSWYVMTIYATRSVAVLQGYSTSEMDEGIILLGGVELSLEKDGINFLEEMEDSYIFEVSLNKKIKLPTFDNAPFLVKDFETYKTELMSDDNTTSVFIDKGNMKFRYIPGSGLYFYEKGKNTKNNTYTSIINFFKFYYGKDVSSEYPELKDGVVYGFIIDVDSVDEEDEEGYSLVKLTKK